MANIPSLNVITHARELVQKGSGQVLQYTYSFLLSFASSLRSGQQQIQRLQIPVHDGLISLVGIVAQKATPFIPIRSRVYLRLLDQKTLQYRLETNVDLLRESTSQQKCLHTYGSFN